MLKNKHLININNKAASVKIPKNEELQQGKMQANV